ncbi:MULTISPECIES: hypothetical protein [Actinosynnema]|uniref:hypothetical protein n=1 Tax=Actinosynnema TaxID=40566 RepID=UPI0020A44C15|nr:hypothetical protein [Actinosynnema pretiosum]
MAAGLSAVSASLAGAVVERARAAVGTACLSGRRQARWSSASAWRLGWRADRGVRGGWAVVCRRAA